MIAPGFIVLLSIISAAAALAVAYRFRGRFVPVHWSGFLAMSFGSLVIGMFYSLIATDYHGAGLVNTSRFIFAFILLSTLLLCVGAIVINRDGKG